MLLRKSYPAQTDIKSNFYEISGQNYWKMFQTKTKKSIEKIRNKFKEILDDPLNVITELETEKSILKLNSNSAPGSDGRTSQIYQNHKTFFAPYHSNLFNKMIGMRSS